ncbi:MAG: Rsd/AlgQ family anti-sigma factor [Pseudomonadota bacterium]
MTKTQTRNDTTKATPAEERRGGTQLTIEKLLAERSEMLTLFCRVAGLEPFEHYRGKIPAKELLQEFCQVLVDYLAAGHFSLYERVANGTERRRSVADTAAQYYPKISDSTQTSLDFNDKYDGQNFEMAMGFHDDLSKLGEILAGRIELEDRLIDEIRR